MEEQDDNEIMFIYEWVDSVPLSRSKKNITRDFSDAVLLAEMIKNSKSSLVDLHNYPSAHSAKKKLANWITLNGNLILI